MTHIQTVSIKETRDNLADIINQIAIAKKQYLVTKYGKPQAMMVPVAKKPATKRRLPGFGMWADRKDMQDPARWVTQQRKRWSKRLHQR
jgi:antitoxin (DNA-binding transcriptional repressor) of toxin-antitoxin stability system